MRSSLNILSTQAFPLHWLHHLRCLSQTSSYPFYLIFILGPDPTYAKIEDGQWLNDEVPYGTIHRLASAGDRRGVASEVIAWCLEHCESLRADTHADNKIMQHLLEKNGFARCGIIHVEDGTPRVAYQKLSATVHMQEE